MGDPIFKDGQWKRILNKQAVSQKVRKNYKEKWSVITTTKKIKVTIEGLY